MFKVKPSYKLYGGKYDERTHVNLYDLINNSSRISRIKLIQAELTSFIWVEPSLHEYISFNIRADIVFINGLFIIWTETESSLTEPSRVHEQLGSSNTPIYDDT